MGLLSIADFLMTRACMNTSIMSACAIFYEKPPRTLKESREEFARLTEFFKMDDEGLRKDR